MGSKLWLVLATLCSVLICETLASENGKPKVKEGDILVAPKDGGAGGKASRAVGVKGDDEKWKFPILYDIDTNYFNKTEVKTIKKAIAQIMKLTCATFRPRDRTKDKGKPFIYIQDGDDPEDACSAYIGYIKKKAMKGQAVHLPRKSCMKNEGSAVHELLHVLGLHHEQKRPDRDEWVNVKFNKIIPEDKEQFDKLSHKEAETFGKFDYGSIMQYGNKSFAKNEGDITLDQKYKKGQPTITNDRRVMSGLDAEAVNKMYNCPKDPNLEEKLKKV